MSPAEAVRIVERGIERRAFPSAVVDVGRAGAVVWRQAFGRLMYAADAPLTTAETIYDLASLAKVIATTTRAMEAVEAGAIALDDRVARYLAAWRGADRDAVTIADLLEHASGLTAYLPFFRDHHGRAEFERAICTLPLEYAPRSQSIYSDLGFILLGFILEDVGFPLDDLSFRLKPEATRSRGGRRSGGGSPEATRSAVGSSDTDSRPAIGSSDTDSRFAIGSSDTDTDSRSAIGSSETDSRGFRLQPEDLLFNPPRELRERCAPTELDLWRGRLLQGEVHDENAWALGGVAGHAGLFGTAAGVGAFARDVLKGLTGHATFARPDTFARFARKSTVPGSSRALGWDTMLPTSSCGTRLSPRALGHTGFTGTSLWIDPELDLYVVFLTNRVHPSRDNNAIQPIRRALHDAVASLS